MAGGLPQPEWAGSMTREELVDQQNQPPPGAGHVHAYRGPEVSVGERRDSVQDNGEMGGKLDPTATLKGAATLWLQPLVLYDPVVTI